MRSPRARAEHATLVSARRRATLLLRSFTLAAACVGVLAGCGGPSEAVDCGTRLRYDGSHYATRSDLLPATGVGRSLGTAEEVGCSPDDRDRVYGRAEIFAIRGVDPGIAVAIVRPGRSKPGRSLVYVNEAVARTATPRHLEQRR